MANRTALACIEEMCQKIMNNNLPFGGKIIVLLGDFRQMCPIIPNSSKVQIINASIKSSHLWHLFHIQCLTIPIWNAADPELSTFVDNIGDSYQSQVLLDLLQQVPNPTELTTFVFPPAILHNNPMQCAK